MLHERQRRRDAVTAVACTASDPNSLHAPAPLAPRPCFSLLPAPNSGVVSSGSVSTGTLPLLLSHGVACLGASSIHCLASRTPPAAATLNEQTFHRPGAGISDTAPHADTY